MRKFVVGKDFAESVEFTHAATDELGRLRAEVENDNLLLHRGQNMGLTIILKMWKAPDGCLRVPYKGRCTISEAYKKSWKNAKNALQNYKLHLGRQIL